MAWSRAFVDRGRREMAVDNVTADAIAVGSLASAPAPRPAQRRRLTRRQRVGRLANYAALACGGPAPRARCENLRRGMAADEIALAEALAGEWQERHARDLGRAQGIAAPAR